MISDDAVSMLPGGLTRAGLRKRILLALLAEEALAKRELRVEPEAIQSVMRWYRARFELLRDSDLNAFLTFHQLSRQDFDAVMRTFAVVELAESQYGARIDAERARHNAVLSARDWLLRKMEP